LPYAVGGQGKLEISIAFGDQLLGATGGKQKEDKQGDFEKILLSSAG